MNLRTSILRGFLGMFALALFSSVQAQTLTFDADSWPSELSVCIVTFNGDTIFNETSGSLIWPNGGNTLSLPLNIGTYGPGDYTVTMDDTYGDGGLGFFVTTDGTGLNCTGTCSAAVASCGGSGNYCLETWSFSLTSDVPGCTDSLAINYDDTATLDDGSCIFDACPDASETMVFVNMGSSYFSSWNGNEYELYSGGVLVSSGSLDGSAITSNFGQDTLCLQDGCYELVVGGGSSSFDLSTSLIDVYTGETITTIFGSGSSSFYFGEGDEVCGCTDPSALNYNVAATSDDGSCISPNCPDGQTLVQFVMYDTFGDGWDGTTYTLTNGSGEVVSFGSITSAQFVVSAGQEAYDFFCLSDTDCYTLAVTGGIYPGEKEWEIIDYTTGTVLYSQTNNDGFGVFGVAGPGVSCGCTNSDAFNYDADATADDGSCFLPSCLNNPDSTSYLLYLEHDIYLFWGNNGALITDPATGDTLLQGGYVNGAYTPDYETSPVEGYFEFCVPNDACLSFSGGGGSTFGTPSWSILDFAGNELHAGSLGTFDIGFGSSAGSCLSGCTLTAAINYDPAATIDDGSCQVCDNGDLGFFLTLQDNNGNGWNSDWTVVSEEDGDTVLIGTMEAGPTTIEQVYCLSPGCYTFNTGSIFGSEGWAIADNLGNAYTELTFDDAVGVALAFGGPDLTDCAFAGCTDPLANNYEFSASVDDESCIFPPANDAQENAQATACGLVLPGSIANANGDEYNGTTILGNGVSNNGAVWYEFNADQDYQVTFTTCNSGQLDNGISDTDMFVFVENGDGSLTPVGTNDDNGNSDCGTLTSTVSINAEQGNNYFIRVGTWSSTTSQTEFILTTECATCELGFPVNDDICGTVLPLVDGGSYDGSTCCSAPDDNFGLSNVSTFASTYGIWYELDVDPAYNLYNIVIAATGDGAVGYGVYSADDCSTNVNDLQTGVVQGAAQTDMAQFFGSEQEGPVTVSIAQPNANLTYYLYIWTTQTADCGPFSLDVSAEILGCTDEVASNYNPAATVNTGCLYVGVVQPNDSCDNAISVACGAMVSGSTGGSTAVGGQSPCGGSSAGVWYNFDNGGVEQLVTISTCGSTVLSSFDVFQEVDSPDATLEVNSLAVNNFTNISAVIVYEGDTVQEIPAGSLFPTVFNNYFYTLSGGDYTVYYTNGGSEADIIEGMVIASDGSNQSLLCSGDCSLSQEVAAGATVEQSFSIFGGTGACSSSLCWTDGNNQLVTSESCDNGETFQFISDVEANNYLILVSSPGSLGGPFDLSIECEPVVYGCQDASACNFNENANVEDPNDPCDFTSCLECETETWTYCYDNNDLWSFTLVNPDGGTIVIDLAGTLIEQNFDELIISDAATGAVLYNSDVDPDESVVFGVDSVTVSFDSDGSVSCQSSTTGYNISMAITCAPAPTTGCNDPIACNYDGPVDFADNDLCDFSCLGCTDDNAVNFNPFATVDDGSCCVGAALLSINMSGTTFGGWNGSTYNFYDSAGELVLTGGLPEGPSGTDPICIAETGCYTLIVTDGTVPGAVSWNITGAVFNEASGGTGTFTVGLGEACSEGCGLPFAPNFVSPDSVDIVNNDLCDFENYVMGCTYAEASNYMMDATNDDGSCLFDIADSCPTDLNDDGQTTTSDLLIFLGQFGTECQE